MKKIILSLMLTGMAAFSAGPAPQNVTLTWSAPSPYPASLLSGITYEVFQSTDLTVPMTNWTIVATLTNQPQTNLQAILPVTPGAYFWALRPRNFWGPAPFSNVASTPPVLPQTSDLGVKLGP
jgi:hypothetical protein